MSDIVKISEIRANKKPDWIRVKAPNSYQYNETRELIADLGLNTVCQEAACPNIGECWAKKHATVMILGSVCTRACRFCNVKTGRPDLLDPHEPQKLAQAVMKLALEHVVITSVDRDDLEDGGAEHFANCIKAIRQSSPCTTIEVLTPDFLRKEGAAEIVVRRRRVLTGQRLALALAAIFIAAYAGARLTGHWDSPIPGDVYRTLIPSSRNLDHPR